MTEGEEGGRRAGLVAWAQDARARSAAYRAQAVAAAESAATISVRVDRMIGRAAERNPEYAERLQAIVAAAASRRAAIAEWKHARAAGRSGSPSVLEARNEADAEPGGQLRDMTIVQDENRTAGELHDKVIQGIFTAGLMLQDAGDLTAEPEVRWRIEAAADTMNELICVIRGALFHPTDRLPSREPRGDQDGVPSPAR